MENLPRWFKKHERSRKDFFRNVHDQTLWEGSMNEHVVYPSAAAWDKRHQREVIHACKITAVEK